MHLLTRCLLVSGSIESYLASDKRYREPEDSAPEGVESPILGNDWSLDAAAREISPARCEVQMGSIYHSNKAVTFRLAQVRGLERAATSVIEDEDRLSEAYTVQDCIEPPDPHMVGLVDATGAARISDEYGAVIQWPFHKGESYGGPTYFKPIAACQTHDHLIMDGLNWSRSDGKMGETGTGVKAWKAFTAQVGVAELRPLDPNAPLAAKLAEEHLAMQFIAWLLGNRAITPTSAANYFGQVQGYQRLRTGIKLAGGLQLNRLPAMIKGLRRLQGEPHRKVRRGISPKKLQQAMDKLLDKRVPAHANIRAAVSLGLQGLLRSHEYTWDGKRPNWARQLSRADVTVLDLEKLVLMMLPCKNMRHLAGKTVPLVVGAGGKYVDAVAEMNNLFKVDPVRGDPATTPLFRDVDGKALTYESLLAWVKRLMASVGENPDEFGTHSLRIGGATALFAMGADPTVIRTMGRWSSDCYRLYVRACYEATMAWSVKAGSADVTDLAGEFDEVADY